MHTHAGDVGEARRFGSFFSSSHSTFASLFALLFVFRLLSAAEYDHAIASITTLLDVLRHVLPPERFDAAIELRVTPSLSPSEGAATPAQPFVWRHGIPPSAPPSPLARPVVSPAGGSAPSTPHPHLSSVAAALEWANELSEDGAQPVPSFNMVTQQCGECQEAFTSVSSYKRHYHKAHTKNFVCTVENNPNCPASCHRLVHGHKPKIFGSKTDLISHLERGGKPRLAKGSTSGASSPSSSAAAAAATGMGGGPLFFSPPLPTDSLPALLPFANSSTPKGSGRGLRDEGVFGADDIHAAAPHKSTKSTPSSPRVAPAPVIDLPVPDLPPDLSQVLEGDEDMAPELQEEQTDMDMSHFDAAATASPPPPLLPAIAALAGAPSVNAHISGPVPMEIAGAAPTLPLGTLAPSVPPPTAAPALSALATPSSLVASSAVAPVPSVLGAASAANDSDTDSEDEAPLMAPSTAVRSTSPRQLGP